MGTDIKEGELTFTFPDSWNASNYDQWTFYRNHFTKICTKTKAIDILAIDQDNRCAWLIEVKDYRFHRRTKPSHLAEEIACKMKDTMAGLACGRVNANDPREQQLSEKMMQVDQLRVVLHLEQPKKHSKLFPRVIDPADIQWKLRKLVKAIDPHPLVLDKSIHTRQVSWTVLSD